MPTRWWAFLFLGETFLLDILKKLFGGNSVQEETSPPKAELLSAPVVIAKTGQFLRREAVFDRNNRLSGHVFYLQQSTLLANADDEQQRIFDKLLINTLNTSPEAWNTSLAFIPLSSSSLDLGELERLKTTNIVLLVQLAADAEADIVCDAIDQLFLRGFHVGIFRQPKNPAFTKAIRLADYAAIDIAANEPESARGFSAAIRTSGIERPIHLIAFNVETLDEHRFCHQLNFNNFHGKFASSPPELVGEVPGDPQRGQLLNLLRLVQGDAEIAEIAAAMKQDPVLSFRILRYLNSPALALNHRIDSLEQALIILGRQRLSRWLAVLLFSVRNPHVGDWLMIENALTRGRLMEVLAEQAMPGQSHDPLFLTGIFSCLGTLLHKPLADILDDMLLADDIRTALLEHSGPYAPLLGVAIASENSDQQQIEKASLAAGVDPDSVNRALLSATAWASEVTEYWE